MKGTTLTTVASGIIGKWDDEWEVVKFYDQETDISLYELFIDVGGKHKHFATKNSVAEALAVLIDIFSE